VDPETNIMFINATSNGLGISVIDVIKRIVVGTAIIKDEESTWYDFNLDKFSGDAAELKKALNNPLAEAFYYMFKLLHREELLREATADIVDDRAKKAINRAIKYMRKVRKIDGLEEELLKTKIAYTIPEEVSNMKSFAQVRYEKFEDACRRTAVGAAIGFIGIVDLPSISTVLKLPLEFVEKLTATTTAEEGYDMYLMHLFETARECFKNGEDPRDVLLKTQLSRAALNMIRELDPEKPLSAIFEELKNTGVYAWEPPFVPSVIAPVYA
jgi:hypothetical protein